MVGRESTETKLADLTAIVSDTAKSIGTTSTKIYGRGPGRALVSGAIHNRGQVNLTVVLNTIRGTERQITLPTNHVLRLRNLPLDSITASATAVVVISVFLIAWAPTDHEAAMRDAGLEIVIARAEGRILNVLGTNPAAGAQITITVPSSKKWDIGSVRFSLVTDANVATRTVRFIIDDGTNIITQKRFGATQAASLTRTYEVIFGEKADETAFDTDNIIRLYIPPSIHPMPAGWRMRTTLESGQVGDDFSAPYTNLEEWDV